MAELFIGLMSGTSLDGVDGVLVEFQQQKPRLIQHQWASFAPDLRAELLALNSPGANELHRAALAANALARLYVSVVADLLRMASCAAQAVRAIGAHGQTVRHRPQEFDGCGYTLQLNNPALLAQMTGIDVVADFRSRDIAAGGQGAPLVPAFHREIFNQARQKVCVLNIGGIANLSVLDGAGGVSGFDCGPGNALMDYWCQRHRGAPFDADGAWAASGQIHPGLLQTLMAEPFLHLPPPKSTGRDLFNPLWLQDKLQAYAALPAQDVQASLTEWTAQAAAQAVLRYGHNPATLLVCGGGALNKHLMASLQRALPTVQVGSTVQVGVDPMQVEAMAFAWLARKTVLREPLALQAVTGARGERVLGCIYPR